MKVNYNIARIPFFRIDIPLFSKSIWFDAKMTKKESDDKIKLREILRLPCLSLDQHLGGRKILKVFIIYNNVDKASWTF